MRCETWTGHVLKSDARDLAAPSGEEAHSITCPQPCWGASNILELSKGKRRVYYVQKINRNRCVPPRFELKFVSPFKGAKSTLPVGFRVLFLCLCVCVRARAGSLHLLPRPRHGLLRRKSDPLAPRHAGSVGRVAGTGAYDTRPAVYLGEIQQRASGADLASRSQSPFDGVGRVMDLNSRRVLWALRLLKSWPLA